LATVNLSSDNNFISLEFYLKHTSLVICHGGHETVMAAIRQKKPMIIIPNNLEQLEIGRRVQELSLGILINKPYQTIKIEELKNSITSLMANKMVQSKLDFFSSLIYQSKGAQVAAQFIDEQLELLKFNENIFSSNNLN
jgi:UDP:flavonoid glycosyltransferase YjiC (YdhE family)